MEVMGYTSLFTNKKIPVASCPFAFSFSLPGLNEFCTWEDKKGGGGGNQSLNNK